MYELTIVVLVLSPCRMCGTRIKLKRRVQNQIELQGGSTSRSSAGAPENRPDSQLFSVHTQVSAAPAPRDPRVSVKSYIYIETSRVRPEQQRTTNP